LNHFLAVDSNFGKISCEILFYGDAALSDNVFCSRANTSAAKDAMFVASRLRR
jgi:hypothetical protein